MKKNTTFYPLSIRCILAFFGLFSAFSTVRAQVSPAVNIQFRSRVPNRTGVELANICGFAAKGKEYALVGTSQGMDIVEVTNPDQPKLIRSVAGPTSIWREIKTYKNYAYVTTEATGQGLQIVDLTNLPDTSLAVKNYRGPDSTLQIINRIHALHVDTAKGFVYLYGGDKRFTDGSTNNGGVVVLDLKDPWNPKFAGKLNDFYVHDGYVNNDTLYSSNIFNGNFAIVDFRNKANPEILSRQTTPTSFTHNTWLTLDQKNVLTTDEECNSYLASYNVADARQPRFLDKIQSPGYNNAIVHNTHILNNYAVTSWYTEGVTIVDAHRPQNLVQVGQYDTYDDPDVPFFAGAWGVFPYLPSGNLVVSDIQKGLFVLTPQYKRACYLEGIVTDSSTNQPLSGVRVRINSTDMDKRAESTPSGNYYTGQVTPGTFSVTYQRVGYAPKTVNVTLATAQITTQNIALRPMRFYGVSGSILDATTGTGVKGAKLLLKNDINEFAFDANDAGNFSISVPEGTYQFYVGSWGYTQIVDNNFVVNSGINNLTRRLNRGYRDDFWTDFGWRVQTSASSGAWLRTVPNISSTEEAVGNPSTDEPRDSDTRCFITGNGNCEAGSDDVDNGSTILTSPKFSLKNVGVGAALVFSYWFTNKGGSGTPNDTLRVSLTNGVKDTAILVVTNANQATNWRQFTLTNLTRTFSLDDSLQLVVYTNDFAPGHVLKAGFDNFSIFNVLSTQDVASNWRLEAYPNPFSTAITVNYALETDEENAQIKVYNPLGQVMATEKLSHTEGVVTLGEALPTGLYLVRIESASGRVSKSVRIVKSQN